jgi:uncharacterized membrane protein YdjX (TVP38/TMEM64 family)
MAAMESMASIVETEEYQQMEEKDEENRFCLSNALHHVKDAFVWIHDHIDRNEVAFAVVAIGLAILGFTHQDTCISAWKACTAYFAQLGTFATVPIAVLCIVFTVVGIPVDFVLVWAGAFFQSTHGLVVGASLATAACCVGVYFGCIAAFLLGQTVMKPKVEKYIADFPMVKIINGIIEADGWKFALIMRLSPLIPNEPLNYACAMTSMSLKHMAISTLGSLPKTGYEVWLAAQAADSLSSKQHSGASLPLTITLNVVILLLMVALCVLGKQKYDAYVRHSKAIPQEAKKILTRRSTLRGFNAEMKRTKTMKFDDPRLNDPRLLGA